VKTETLFSTPYLALKQKGRWTYASRVKGRGAVGIVAVTPERKIVLVEQMRIPLGKQVIELPAGLIGDEIVDEGVLDAARKELFEETGYVAATLIGFGEPLCSSAGLSDETIQLFVASGLVKHGCGGGVKGEDITVHEVPLARYYEWLFEQQHLGKVTDSKTFAVPGILQHVGL